MTDLRQAAQQALEALIDAANVLSAPMFADAVDALRTALEQQAEPPPEWESIKNILDEYGLDAIAFVAAWKAAQQQAEPVAYFDFQELKFSWAKHMKISPVPVSVKVEPMKLYSESTKRQWVGLTDEEIFHAGPRIGTSDSNVNPYQILINARAIEAALRSKNT